MSRVLDETSVVFPCARGSLRGSVVRVRDRVAREGGMALKRQDIAQKSKCVLWASTILLSGCVTSMQMSPEKLKRADPSWGTVIGSLQVKGGKEIEIFGRQKWSLQLASIDAVLQSRDPASDYDVPPPRVLADPLGTPVRAYTVQAYRDGEEEVFVARLPPGRYAFWKLYKAGFAPSTSTQGTEIYLTVLPGTVAYVGRVVVQSRPGLISSTQPGRWGCSGLKFSLKVEDASAPALEKARQKYGVNTDVVISSLMELADHSFCGHEFDSKGRLP